MLGQSGGMSGGSKAMLLGAVCMLAFISYHKYSDVASQALSSSAAAAKAKEQADSLAAQLQVVYEHKSRLERSLKESQSSCETAKADLQATLKELRTSADAQKQQLEESNTLTAELRKQINSLKDEKLSKDNQQQDEMEKLRTEISAAKDRLSSVQTSLDGLKTEKESLQSENERLTAELRKCGSGGAGEAREAVGAAERKLQQPEHLQIQTRAAAAAPEAKDAEARGAREGGESISTSTAKAAEAEAKQPREAEPEQVAVPVPQAAQEEMVEREKEAVLGKGGGAIPPPRESQRGPGEPMPGNQILQRPEETALAKDGEEVMVNRRAQPISDDVVFQRNQGRGAPDKAAEAGEEEGGGEGGVLRREAQARAQDSGGENLGPPPDIRRHPKDIRRRLDEPAGAEEAAARE